MPTADSFLTYLSGPLGGFFILLAGIVFLLRGQFITPKIYYDAVVVRADKLEEENVKLNDNVVILTSLNAKMEEGLTHMGKELERVGEESAELKREVRELRRKLGFE